MRRSILLLSIAAVGTAAACTDRTPMAAPDAPALARIQGTSGVGGRLLTATLTGAAEVPGPGDPDGRGTARVTVNPGTGEICYALEVAGIDPAQMAHIHEAPVTASGPVVKGLTPPTTSTSSGCVTDAPLAAELLAAPADYYVNVHNVPFPGGALRGQLSGR